MLSPQLDSPFAARTSDTDAEAAFSALPSREHVWEVGIHIERGKHEVAVQGYLEAAAVGVPVAGGGDGLFAHASSYAWEPLGG